MAQCVNMYGIGEIMRRNRNRVSAAKNIKRGGSASKIKSGGGNPSAAERHRQAAQSEKISVKIMAMSEIMKARRSDQYDEKSMVSASGKYKAAWLCSEISAVISAGMKISASSS